jgi:glycosyltransferase involved in cell wall biosynthesis
VSDAALRVLHVFGRLLRGGAELRTIELVEALAAEGVRSDFLVLTGLEGPLDDRVRAAGGDVLKLRLGPAFPGSFFRLLQSRRYDVVHSHVHYFSGIVLAIALAARVPGRVAHFRSAVVNDRADSRLRRAQLALCRWCLDRSATDILAVGEGTMERAWGPDWRTDARCRIVYNGIPAERLRGLPDVAPAGPSIINVASVQPLKNQFRLVGILRRCLREMPELTLVVVGREIDDYGDTIRRAAADAGIAGRVHLMGEVDDPIPLLASSSLMILPSRWEGLPGAVLEACATGLPVLASDLPGTRELARHFPGVVLLPLEDDDETWASAALRLIRGGRQSPSEAAASFAASAFTIARARDAHYEIWSRRRAS